MNRSSAVLMPMSSLPSNYGIGTMGKSAYKFVDFLKSAGQKYWQLLPLGPTSYGDSPYSSFSTFAGNPYYIDLDMLVKDGLLKSAELEGIDWGSDPQRVDYGRIYNSRFKVLRLAFKRGEKKFAKELADFRAENAGWLEDYALYMAVKAKFDMKSWTEWEDEDIRMHKSEAVEKYAELLREDVDFYVFMQFMFFRQWVALRDYAHKKGVQFIGDIPIYVALDSADVWSEPQFSSSMRTISPWRSRAFRRTLSRRTGSFGATPSTTGTRCAPTATAGGYAASTGRASSMMSSASTISAASRAIGQCPWARRPRKTAAGRKAREWDLSAC